MVITSSWLHWPQAPFGWRDTSSSSKPAAPQQATVTVLHPTSLGGPSNCVPPQRKNISPSGKLWALALSANWLRTVMFNLRGQHRLLGTIYTGFRLIPATSSARSRRKGSSRQMDTVLAPCSLVHPWLQVL